MEEIYVLTKHGKFQSDYVENIPVFKRRFYLNLLKEELEEVKKQNEKLKNKANQNFR